MDFPHRLTWLTRPRWIIVLAGVAGLFAWIFWPIKVYESGINNFLAVAEESPVEILGVVRVDWEESHWKAEDSLNAGFAKSVGNRMTPDGMYWSYEAGQPDLLSFVRGNAVFALEPTDEFLGLKRGDSEWIERIEEVARRSQAQMDTGFLGDRELGFRRVPRVLLYFQDELEEIQKKLKSRWSRWFP